MISGPCAVTFGNEASSLYDAYAGGRDRPRAHLFCKFEYDHQLSVFVPLTNTFLMDRKPALPGTMLTPGEPLSKFLIFEFCRAGQFRRLSSDLSLLARSICDKCIVLIFIHDMV